MLRTEIIKKELNSHVVNQVLLCVYCLYLKVCGVSASLFNKSSLQVDHNS